jgi:hypothetical protein
MQVEKRRPHKGEEHSQNSLDCPGMAHHQSFSLIALQSVKNSVSF